MDKKLLSLLDMFHVDEEIVDRRLKTFMQKTDVSQEHLQVVINLLEYKYAINIQEESDCENEDEVTFCAKLLLIINNQNADFISKIIKLVLLLNKEKVQSYSEHFLQQIQQEMAEMIKDYSKSSRCLNLLKVTDSILDCLIIGKKTIFNRYLNLELERIIFLDDTEVSLHFINITIPKIQKSIKGYPILDKIWHELTKLFTNFSKNVFMLLTMLADFFIPVGHKDDIMYESIIIEQEVFWLLLLEGLVSEDSSIRKYTQFLLKRAIDSALTRKKDFVVLNKDDNSPIFSWKNSEKNKMEHSWKLFFIIVETLEEKQSNLVLAALPLLNQLTTINEKWLYCVLNIALRHETSVVVKSVLQYCLKLPTISRNFPFEHFLNALNSNHLFEESFNSNNIISSLELFLNKNCQILDLVLKTFPCINWSPVPKFYVTYILAQILLQDGFSQTVMSASDGQDIIIETLKQPSNNPLLQAAAEINLFTLFLKLFSNFAQFYNVMDNVNFIKFEKNIWLSVIKSIKLNYNESDIEKEFYHRIKLGENGITKCLVNSQILTMIACAHPSSDSLHFEIVNNSLNNLSSCNSREYSNKKQHLVYFTMIVQFIKTFKTINLENERLLQIFKLIETNSNTLIYFVCKYLEWIPEDEELDCIADLANGLSVILEKLDAKLNPNPHIEQIFKMCKVCLLPNATCHWTQKLLSLKIVSEILKYNYNIVHTESISIQEAFIMLRNIGDNTFIRKPSSKFISEVNTVTCKLFYFTYKIQGIENICPTDLLNVLCNILYAGGYDALPWTMKIFKELIPILIERGKNIEVNDFIDHCWREIVELKSNDLLRHCIEILIEVIFHTSMRDVNSNVAQLEHLHLLLSSTMELSVGKTIPYCLAKYFKINAQRLSNDLNALALLCDLLLIGGLPRKDQRIENSSCKFILEKFPISDKKQYKYLFVEHTRSLAIQSLVKLSSKRDYEFLSKSLRERVDSYFKNKQRYYENSNHHRVLLRALQNLLLVLLLRPENAEVEKTALWCVELLGSIPHQQSTRICMEWYISVYVIIKKLEIKDDLIKRLKLDTIPQISMFNIIYHVVHYRNCSLNIDKESANFVLDYFLKYTMGQIFSIRLHAQYLAMKLYESFNLSLNEKSKYNFVFEIIKDTLNKSASEKSYVKLKDDAYINSLNVIYNLTADTIFHHLPQFTNESSDEILALDDLPKLHEICDILKQSKETVEVPILHKLLFNDEIYSNTLTSNIIINAYKDSNDTSREINEDIVIQKKFTPWRNMLMDLPSNTLKRRNKKLGNLVVVASLIDRLPNLGGIARTSEVFGVNTYVIDSLRHTQDKQFQSLSVSAEKWINIEEIRPANLTNYVQEMKQNGYSIVAAEQTSHSKLLNDFVFPEKTVLILGHEKEGIPANLLPLMDHCVEIPQRGFVRSLNVHVTAALFIWEYARQYPKLD